ncbi:MAG: GIY-YIG nuclease family protein [Melioribacter sp.]|nr:GIY-YIG nuclease family protein [Melioribacter sp.]
MRKQMYVYILRCSDGTYYTGVTNNIERRLQEHKSERHNSYVSARLPFELFYYEEFNSPLIAIEREKQIKGWSRAKKEALKYRDFDKLKILSKNRKAKQHHIVYP